MTGIFALVNAAAGVTGQAAGGATVSISTISLPNQLVISDVKFAPRVLHSRKVTARPMSLP